MFEKNKKRETAPAARVPAETSGHPRHQDWTADRGLRMAAGKLRAPESEPRIVDCKRNSMPLVTSTVGRARKSCRLLSS